MLSSALTATRPQRAVAFKNFDRSFPRFSRALITDGILLVRGWQSTSWGTFSPQCMNSVNSTVCQRNRREPQAIHTCSRNPLQSLPLFNKYQTLESWVSSAVTSSKYGDCGDREKVSAGPVKTEAVKNSFVRLKLQQICNQGEPISKTTVVQSHCRVVFTKRRLCRRKRDLGTCFHPPIPEFTALTHCPTLRRAVSDRNSHGAFDPEVERCETAVGTTSGTPNFP